MTKGTLLLGLTLCLSVCAAVAVGPLLHHRAIAALDSDAAEQLSAAPLKPRVFYGRRLEPRAGLILHGAGQTDSISFEHYAAAVAPARPLLFMTYVDLRDDLPAYFTALQQQLERLSPHPEQAITIPQIGLALNRGDAHRHYESETSAGMDDGRLLQLCDGLRSLHRPVFLRVGYEFNGIWNGYQPTGYIGAFRRIAWRVHECDLPEIALVWDWSADAELDAEASGAAISGAGGPASRWQAFYPGDDAVDWWALNLFTPAGISAPATRAFLQRADASRHPVMIAESAPKTYLTGSTPTVRKDWFEPYFGLIRSSPGIRAFCYINWDWRGFPQWADWGDSRVESSPALQAWYRTEVNGPSYAQAGSLKATYKLLGVAESH